MKNVHHQLPHALLVMLWGFLSLEGNASKLGLDLNGINLHYIKEKHKTFKVAFLLFLAVLN
jgi:hypothetical protein